MASVYRIVLIDDSTVVREALRWMLENEPDFQIVGEAATGLSGFQLVVATRPDAVILDIELPDFDGYAIAEKLLTRTPGIPVPHIIFLSVHDDAITRQRCARLGAGFAAKNAGWVALIAQMRKVLPLKTRSGSSTEDNGDTADDTVDGGGGDGGGSKNESGDDDEHHPSSFMRV